ncbi:MAG TPA: carbohydrate ABC transporter substrate-binding protein [Christensenellaceae bacterium]|nr:carbohydrate ABC transporter substrate-binding protein [Christensenellaceae bacterium]
MRKFIATLLALVLALGLVPTMAEDLNITLFHNKVEIAEPLQAFAKLYSDKTEGVTVNIETLGGGADYSGNLTAKLTAESMPDIFVIEGDGDYKLWQEYVTDLSDEKWNEETTLAYKDPEGKVVGFPVSIEGFGLGYNVELLKKADVDPATLTTFTALKEAFEKIDGMKGELGLDSVVSMGASVAGGTWWVAGHHNFSIYLGGGLDFEDTSIIDMFNKGEIDEERLNDYAKYVQLLFQFSDREVTTNGTYDDQLAAFVNKKAAFIHQGNWIDPSLAKMNVDFEYDYISHPFNDKQEHKGLYLFAPSFYVVNSKNTPEKIQAAKDFLEFLVFSEEGADYMVNGAGMVPAFANVTLQPSGGFSKALVHANAEGGNHGVFFGKLPPGTGQDILAPIFDLFAQDPSDENMNYFIEDIKGAAKTVSEKQ